MGSQVDGFGSGRAPRWMVGLATAALFSSGLIAGAPNWASAHVRTVAAVAPGPAVAAAAEKVEFDGVAATSPSNAWIVGHTEVGQQPVRTLILHWDGKTWQRVPSPNAPGARTSSFLTGVASVSRDDAWAVGESNLGHGSTLIEHWNGKSWKIVPSPDTPGQFNLLGSVTVAANGQAWATGNAIAGPGSAASTVILHWNGSSWQRMPGLESAAPDARNIVSSITAVSSTSLWAVGEYDAGSSPTQTLIEHWNGSSWRVAASPNPFGNANPDHLTGVAAASTKEIFAVGDAGDVFAPTRTMMLGWDGSKWQNVSLPSLRNPDVDESLTGVAAVSASDVWAVGGSESQTSSANVTLIEHWTGKKWLRVAAPVPKHAVVDNLGAIAAGSAKSIWAVGSFRTDSPDVGQPLLEHWNGSRWTIVSVIVH